MPKRPELRHKPIGRDRIWASRVLSFAVCSQDGRPIYVGSSFSKCLGWYVLLKGRILLEDGPAVAVEFDRLMQDGYTIRRVLVKAFVSDDDIIRSYANGIENEKTDQAVWAKEIKKAGGKPISAIKAAAGKSRKFKVPKETASPRKGKTSPAQRGRRF